jgi:thymidylate synthase
MVAQVCGLKTGISCTPSVTCTSIATVEQAKLQLAREPRPLLQMKWNPKVKKIDRFQFEDFELVGYDPHPAIKAQVAV